MGPCAPAPSALPCVARFGWRPRRRLIAGASPRWPGGLAQSVIEPMKQARPRQLPPCFLAGLCGGSGRCSRVPWLAPPLSVHHLTQDTAEADVAHRRVDGLRMPRGGAVAPAVARCTQVRAALQDLARDPDLRLTGVVTGLFAPAAWIVGNAASLWGLGLMFRGIPVGRPFPDVADHVDKAIAVGGEGPDRR